MTFQPSGRTEKWYPNSFLQFVESKKFLILEVIEYLMVYFKSLFGVKYFGTIFILFN